MDCSSPSQTSTNNVPQAECSRSHDQPGSAVVSRLQRVRNMEFLPPANPPPYPDNPDISAARGHCIFMTPYAMEPPRRELVQFMELRRPGSLPPSYAASLGNVRTRLDDKPEYSVHPREGECILEEGPIGTEQPSEISPELSGGHLQQAQKHVARIEAKIAKFDQFIGLVRRARERGGQITNSIADFSSARDAMVTLRNAWASGSLKGTSRVGMTLGRTAGDRQRRVLEHSVTVAMSGIVAKAAEDFTHDLFSECMRDMARVETAARDMYVMSV